MTNESKKVKKVNKGAVISVVVAFSVLLVVMALSEAKNGNNAPVDPQKEVAIVATTDKTNIPALNSAPKTYADAKKKETINNTEVPNVSKDTTTDHSQGNDLSQAELELALKAKHSDIFFKTNGASQLFAQTHPLNQQGNGVEKMFGDDGSGFPESEMIINQKNKKRFLNEMKKSEAIHLDQRIVDPVSPYMIFATTVIPGVMITGINSALPGEITGQVRENVYDTVTGRHLLLPMGTKIKGKYDNIIAWGQNRVMLGWSRLIFPNGSSINLEGMSGTDLGGYQGLKDKVNHHWGKMTGAILLSSILAVGAKQSQGDEYNSIKQDMASSVGEDINKAGQKIVDRILNLPPTIQIRPGHKFNILVNKDIILKPYAE